MFRAVATAVGEYLLELRLVRPAAGRGEGVEEGGVGGQGVGTGPGDGTVDGEGDRRGFRCGNGSLLSRRTPFRLSFEFRLGLGLPHALGALVVHRQGPVGEEQSDRDQAQQNTGKQQHRAADAKRLAAPGLFGPCEPGDDHDAAHRHE